MAADDSAKRRSDSFVPAVDRWYYTAKNLRKQERTFIFLHFMNESFSLYNVHSAQSCNSLLNFTKFHAVFAEHCRNSGFCLIRRMERVPPPTELKRCSLCRMREIPPRRIGDSCSERISGLAIRRVTRYNKEHLVFSIMLFQYNPVSIAECCAFCSETIFFMNEGNTLGDCPDPFGDIVPRLLLRFAQP